MRGFRVQESIDRPRGVVWAALLDTDRWPDIVEGLDEVRRLDEPPTGLGSRFQETRTLGGRTERFIVEVTGFEPELLYAASVFYQGAEFRYTYTLEDAAAGGGTVITMEAEVIARSLLARTLFRPMLGIALRMMKKHDSDQLERLKESLEAEPVGAAGDARSGLA